MMLNHRHTEFVNNIITVSRDDNPEKYATTVANNSMMIVQSAPYIFSQ